MPERAIPARKCRALQLINHSISKMYYIKGKKVAILLPTIGYQAFIVTIQGQCGAHALSALSGIILAEVKECINSISLRRKGINDRNFKVISSGQARR